MEHDGSFIVLGHALGHSMRGHGCRDPEPHPHFGTCPKRAQPRMPSTRTASSSDNTLNLPVVAWQPHPDPNYTPHAAARRAAGA